MPAAEPMMSMPGQDERELFALVEIENSLVVSNPLIFVCSHGYEKITYTHSISSFLAEGNILTAFPLCSPPKRRN